MTSSFLNLEPNRRSERNLLLAGIDSVADLGIDQVTAAVVIARAGVSRPTFYSYFDDIADLMAECWIQGGATWFDTLLWGRLPEGIDVTSEHRAYMDMLMAASRTPALADVILPDMATHWERIQTQSDAEQVRLLWTLGTLLGIYATEFVMPSVRSLHSFVEGMRLLPSDIIPDQEIVDLLNHVEPIVSEPLLSEGGDAIRRRLINAVIQVVSRSGVANTSMTRVCRAARVTTGAAKPRFTSLADLMSSGYDHAIAEVANQNVSQSEQVFGGVSPIMAYTRLVISALSPSRRSWRRYRQEMHLASRVNEAVREQMASSTAEVNKVLVDTLRASNVDESIIDISIQVNLVHSVGFSLIDDLGIPIRNVNHAVVPATVTVEMFAALAN